MLLEIFRPVHAGRVVMEANIMRRCKDCKIILEDSVRYCPKCGKNVQEDGFIETPNAQIGILITSANLHRVRQEWDKAIADATEALNMDPNNAGTVSLLANIYEQRGMMDEARIWYQAALELNPGGTADKARLDRINAQIVDENKPAADTSKRFTGAQIGIFAAVFVFIISLTLFLTLGTKPRTNAVKITPQNQTSRSKLNLTQSTPRNSAKSSSQPRTSESSLDGRNTINADSRTTAELAIRNQLNESQDIESSGAKIDDVIADPREEVAIVTFSIPAGGSITKVTILVAASTVARQTFGAHSQVKYVTTRCIIAPSNSESSQIAFVGDVARTSLNELSGNPNLEQLQRIFANPWWNPQIEQSQP